MKRKTISFSIITFSLLLISCASPPPADDPIQPTSAPQDAHLENTTLNARKLLPPEGDSIYFGAFPDFGGPEDDVTAEKIADFVDLAGRNIVWAYFSNNWIKGITYPAEAIHTIHESGSIPFVRLMPRSDLEQYHPEKTYSMQNIIDGVFDDDLHAWASLAREDNIPLLIDFAVEMNGDWFSWSGIFNGKGRKGYGDKSYFDGPERYRDAYRHIIDIFRSEGAHNVTWFFHPDIHSFPDQPWNEARFYYPGDDYIDWIAVSIYGPQHPAANYWETFSEILEDRYQSILDISSNKPIALLEFGVTDNHPLGKKDAWLEDAFETILDNPYLQFQAVSYWHENWEQEDNLYATIRIDSSPESLSVFREYASHPRFSVPLLFSGTD